MNKLPIWEFRKKVHIKQTITDTKRLKNISYIAGHLQLSRWLFIFSVVKQFKIALNKTPDKFQLFGINTILKDYQLCLLINDFFNIKTHLLETEHLNPSLSVFGDIIDDLKVILVQNRPVVFPKLSAFEYIVVVNKQDDLVSDLVKSFEKNDEILLILEIDHKHISSKTETLIHQFFSLL